MSKRPNEDSLSDLEPAAKRFADQNEIEINIIAEQKLQAARSALARLDYENAEQLCTELIDSNYSDPSVPLILRSLTLETQAYLDAAVEDAERALELKESKRTHLRCSFAYLAHAFHHLELAQKQPLEDEQEGDRSVSEAEIKEFSHKVRDFKFLEAGNPFRKRVSEDLLLQMASFFDSPSLSIFSATCKSLRASIHGSKELFRVFKMSGKGRNVTGGINSFSQRCGNSIKSIDIEVKNKLDQKPRKLLQKAISLSASTLGAISICHQRDLCKLIIQVASMSPSLKILSSTHTDGALTALNDQFLEVPPSWDLKLTKLLWDGGAESLVCNDTLLRSLQSANEVKVYSNNIRPSWVLDLLFAASSTLVDVNIPTTNQEVVDEIPSLIALPKLDYLRLDRIPQSRSTQVPFFKSLHAPNLRALCLDDVNVKDLLSFPPTSSLRSFSVLVLLKTDGTLASEAGEEAATSFVKAIKDWKELCTLEFLLEGYGFSSFYTHLVDLLTPFSQTSEESGLENRFLLPKLQSLILGDTDSSTTDDPISAKKLATFLGIRSGLWKGLSSDQISSMAAGDLSQVDQKPQGTPFAPVGTYSRITDLEINIPLEADDETLSWLKKKVRWLEIRHRVAPKCPLEQDRRSEEV